MQKSSVKQLASMFWIFFKIGAFTIGGGLAMIPVIQHEVVDKQGWLSEKEVVDVFAISQSLPGVIAINSSIFLGYKTGKLIGSIVAALGVILPSFLIILAIFFTLHQLDANHPYAAYIAKAFAGVRACVAAMICITIYKMSKTTMKDLYSYIIAALTLVLLTVYNTDIAFLIVGSGILGYLIYLAKEKLEQSKEDKLS